MVVPRAAQTASGRNALKRIVAVKYAKFTFAPNVKIKSYVEVDGTHGRSNSGLERRKN